MDKSIGDLVELATEANMEPDDYINKMDGLMYCGKCHTPKEVHLDEPYVNGKKTMLTNCDCCTKEIEEKHRKEALRKHFRTVKQLRLEGIRDKKILEWTFANDTSQSKQIEIAKGYVEKFPKVKAENTGLLLWGNVGTGKSFVAGCIANALIDKEVSVLMTNFGIILGDMTNLKIDKNQYIANLNRKSLLIIDDFGMERDTAFAMEQIYKVIDSRYTASKPLIVTTNLTLQELQNNGIETHYRRIYDRVLEMCVPIFFDGESKRKANATEKMNKLKEILG